MNGAGVCVCPEPVAGLVVVDGAIIARAAADAGGSSCCGSVRRDGVSPRHPGVSAQARRSKKKQKNTTRTPDRVAPNNSMNFMTHYESSRLSVQH